MKSPMVALFSIAAFVTPIATATAGAEDEKPSAQVATSDVSARPRLGAIPIYRPNAVGKPARTVGGGSRGPGDGFPDMYVLVPDHVARTASRRPALFWYIDDVPEQAVMFEFTLLHEDDDKPTLRATLPTPRRAGIHRIDLSDYGVELQPGAEYEWNVALVPDPEDRAQDVVSTGWIDCVEKPADLEARIAAEGSSRSVFVLADEGLWYDAFANLEAQLASDQSQTELIEMRAALLRQIGLDEVAKAL